jgi:hypothetical protein
MDYMDVLKRAWHMVWRYRALWVFGIILALVVAGSAGNGGTGAPGYDFDRDDFRPGWRWSYDLDEVPLEVVGIAIAVGVGLLLMALCLVIATAIARYVAETALIRLVDDHEETGEKRSVGQGFRMGWSRSALRLFLINLLIRVPTALAFLLLFALALAPLLVWFTESTGAGVIASIAAGGLFFLVVLLAIVVGAVLSVLIKFFWRACALDGLGVIESIRQGYGLVRRQLKDVVVMGLIMLGVNIGWAILMIAVTIVLFPVFFLLFIVAITVAGTLAALPALAVYGLVGLFFEGAAQWILAFAVGLPIFILGMVVMNLLLGAPGLFLGGLMEVFKSSVWTLTYRELRALEGSDTAGD